MAKLHDHKGFTLLEMMLVMFIISIILLLVFSFKPNTTDALVNSEIEHIENFLMNAQTLAMASNERHTLLFDFVNNRILLRNRSGININTLQLQYCFIRQGSLNRFDYLPNGDTNAFGRLNLYCNQKNISFIFQIQKGRYRIEQ